jgi:hypothetical protein
MDGDAGLPDQIDDRRQTAFIWNRESSVDAKAKLCKPDDVGKIEILGCVVVRDVEEDRLDAAQSWHTRPSVCH